MRGGQRGSHFRFLTKCCLASSVHGHLLWVNLQGGGSTSSLAAVNKAASLPCFAAFRADPGIHLALLYDYHKRLDCLHKTVEWRRGPPLPLVACFLLEGPSVSPG